MNALVVDTDVVSFAFKKDTRAEGFRRLLYGRPLLVSFMTEAELERWSLQSRWGTPRVEQLRSYLARFVVVPSSPA